MMKSKLVEVMPFEGSAGFNLATPSGCFHSDNLLGIGTDHDSRAAGSKDVLAVPSERTQPID